MSSESKVWLPYKDEDEYEQAVQKLFFNKLALRLHKSKNLRFDRTVLQRAWNLQVCSQGQSRAYRRRKPLSLESKFYVYVLMDPRKPGKYEYSVLGKKIIFSHEVFYVGKGFGNRSKYHIWEVKNKPKRLAKDYKGNKIRKLLVQGLEPIIKIITHNCIESIALVKEMLLISTIGRVVSKDGPLTNKSLGGEGQTGVILTRTQLEERSSRMKGRKSPVHSKHMKELWKDKKFREKICKNRDYSKSEEHRAKIGAANRKPKSEQGKANMRGIPRKRTKCPHCEVTGIISNMNRWHFDNCKHLKKGVL